MRAEIRVNKLHCVSYASLKPNEYFYAFVKITTQCPSMKMRLIFIRNEVVSLMGNTDRTYLSFTSRIFPNRVYESPDFWRTCSFIFLSRFVPFRQRDPAAISFLFFFFSSPPFKLKGSSLVHVWEDWPSRVYRTLHGKRLKWRKPRKRSARTCRNRRMSFNRGQPDVGGRARAVIHAAVIYLFYQAISENRFSATLSPFVW